MTNHHKNSTTASASRGATEEAAEGVSAARPRLSRATGDASSAFGPQRALALAIAALTTTGAYAQTESGGGNPSLPTVTVTDTAEKASGPAQGFVAKRSATGTKTDTPLIETPQSVSVVTRAQIEAQAADSLDQALGYTSGIMSVWGGANRHTLTGFTIRGFNGLFPLYLNGSKFPLNSFGGAIEPYGFERIELLKGPASVLYGQAAPGGIINLVSKRPTAEPFREIEVQAGSWDRRQGAVDLGGPLSEDGRVRYRLTALGRNSDTMIREIKDDRISISGALEWQLTNSTLLTLLATYNKTEAGYDAGKPFEGTLLPNRFGQVSRKLFLGEPNMNKFDTEGSTLGYLLEHKFNDNWTFRQNLLAYHYDSDYAYASVAQRVLASNNALVNRTGVTRLDANEGISLDNQLQGKLQHGLFQHTLLMGLDWNKDDFSRRQATGAMRPLNMYAPVYGTPTVLGAARDSIADTEQLGFYVQDHIKFDDRWIALLGGRYDTARTYTGGTTTEKAHAFSPRLGLMYLFDSGFAPYYSFTKSFEPSSGLDFNRNPFKPTTGKQHEVGLKYEPRGTNASVTVSAFEITQQNVLTTDPAHVGFQIQTGEIRSRGIEIEGRASINRQLDLVASLSSTDAEITKSNNNNVGSRPTSVPRHMASLWADYKFQSVPGLSMGFGVRNVGTQEILGNKLPTYTVFDAAVRYQWERWQFALNLKNLTDKTYVAACSFTCYYGDERNFTLTARYRW
jgi:iron complex outermembrane receptor protein